ncbi:MAG: F0F1 ATP synthase subunit delta [Gammaproteobacteria bacterium]|nr:F0F1 ATP synthase subunit delta [Gammaproteobacteria bacterium]
MSEARTVARPYAEAALHFATQNGTTLEWSNQLALLSAISSNELAKELIKDPRISLEQQVELFSDVAVSVLDENGRNFVQLLAEYRRLILLPEIFQEYQRLLAEQERQITAEVRTAQPLTDEQIAQMSAALKKRFDSAVIIKAVIDESLLGGALIQIGDLVIDGSLRGRLTSMAAALRS